MGITTLLQEERSQFISLRELLELLTKYGNGCTLKDAAAFLYSRLKAERDAGWCIYDPAEGFDIISMYQVNEAMDVLKLVARTGVYSEQENFGWDDEVPF